VFALLAALVSGYEAWHAVPLLWSDTTGRLGMEADELSLDRARITALQPWSPLVAEGLRPGDVLVADRWYDLHRRWLPGESLDFSVERGSERRRLTVQAVPGPHLSTPLRWFFFVQIVGCAIGIVFGVWIGWRQPESIASRALAIAFVGWGINLYPSASPPGWSQQIEQLVFSLALAPPWFALACFAIYFPDDVPVGLRARLARWIPALAIAGLVVFAITALRGLGVTARLHVPAVTAYSAVTGLIVLACFADGWRRGHGARRTRFGWLLATFLLQVTPAWFPGMAEWLGWSGFGWLFFAMGVCGLIGYGGLAYAVLRHRVIDLGVALNRSLAVAAAGLAVLGLIKLTELTLAQLARPGEPMLATLVGAALAVVGFAAFQRARPAVIGLLDRAFFPRWVARTSALRRFADEAADAEDATVLADGFVHAVRTFELGGGAAIYVEDAAGFGLLASSFPGAPISLAHGDPVLASLREGGTAVTALDGNATAILALPMTRRAGSGLVMLVAPRAGEEPWHDDDVRVLAETALSVGADLQLIEWKMLRAGRPARAQDDG